MQFANAKPQKKFETKCGILCANSNFCTIFAPYLRKTQQTQICLNKIEKTHNNLNVFLSFFRLCFECC